MRARRMATVIGLALALGACAFPIVPINRVPNAVVIIQGQGATVTLESGTPECDTNNGLPCPDITGRVFNYLLQDVPDGLSYTLDTSLQSAATPGLVRITFHAAAELAPSLYEVAIHALLDGRTIGLVALPIRVLAATTTTASAAAVVAGPRFSMAVLTDGTLMAWGANESGQLGSGDLRRHAVPMQVRGLTGVVAAAAGKEHVLALTRDGRVWAWGGNSRGQLGNAPSSDTAIVTSPTVVAGPQDIRAISAGRDHSLAADVNGLVWTWGNFGYDDRVRSTPPTLVPNLPPIRSVAAAVRESFGVDTNGSVWRWGFFRNGPITPRQVAGLSEIQDIATDGFTHLALDSSGRVWGWGHNRNDLFGPGPEVDISTPVTVGDLRNVRSIAISDAGAVAALQDGTVFSWGSFISAPPTAGLSGVGAVAMGSNHLVASLACGAIWTSGLNNDGQLGDGTTDPRDGGPQPVPGVGDDATCARVALRVPFVDVAHSGNPVTVRPGTPVRGFTEDVGIFERGAQVTLTAVPTIEAFGILGRHRWTFDRWDFDCSGTDGSTVVVLDRSKRCAAVYREDLAELFLLTVHSNGGGRVTSSSGDVNGLPSIRCPEQCSAVFRSGARVTLQAFDDNGFAFTHWTGDCSGTSRETTVTMDQARSCTAHFRPFTLAVGVTGTGVVSRDGSFDECTGTCTFTPRAATATLRATPAQGWLFDGWSGDCAGTSVVTTADMRADRACVARFVRDPGFFFLTLEVLGLGSVTSEPPGVACSATCVFLLPAGSVYDLTAHGTAQTMPSVWGDDCFTGAIPVNQVVMDRDERCSVLFVDRAAFPIAQMTWMPPAPRVGQIATFDGNDSYVFAPATGLRDFSAITRWSWDFDNDGVFEGSGGRTAAAIVQRVFQATGRHLVRLRVDGGPVSATDDELQEVTVLESTAPLFNLTAGKTGGGQGTIASDPQGLVRCDEICAGAAPLVFEPGSVVTLVATPAPGSQFAGWSGCDTVNAERCTVTLGSDRAVTATFMPVSTNFTLSVMILTDAVAQLASVRAVAPPSNAINCFATLGGPVCGQGFPAGTVVSVRPSDLVLESGWLAVWSGCDSVSTLLTCEVALTSNRVVTLSVQQR